MEITLQATLASILTELASFFGMTTQAIIENAPYWLARYGWYVAFQNLIPAFFIGVGIVVIFLFILFIFNDATRFLSDWSNKALRKFVLIISALILILSMAMPVVQCAVAPEMYAIKPLIQMIK